MMPAFDRDYDRVSRKIQPRAIHSKKEHTRLVREIERLMLKGEKNLTPAETSLLETLAILVQDYELKLNPLGKHTPSEILVFLMEQNSLTASDLPLPASRVSEIINGKRKVSKPQAIALAKRFHVSPALFRPSI